MKKRKLEHIVTRDYHPITLQQWYCAASRGMKNLLGVGWSDVIMHSDGITTQIFRLADELRTSIKKAMLKYVQTREFDNSVEKWKKEMILFKQMVRQKAEIRGIFTQHERIFPVMAIGYYVANVFPDFIPARIRRRVIKKCLKYRIITNELMDGLDSAVKAYIKINKLPYYTTIEGKTFSWMKNGFVATKGKFYKTNWEDFLKRNNYYLEDEKSVKDGQIKGFVAFKGRVVGRVCKILNYKDFPKFKNGNVLIAHMTQVSYLPVLKKAKAIVTDEGGITCHAAIVSRELGIPCVIGTKIATRVLKDGDRVEVDATRGFVKVLSRH